MTNLGNGSGISFGVIIDNKVCDFKLGLIETTLFNDMKEVHFVFFMDNTDIFYQGSLYSGGDTGFGISIIDINCLKVCDSNSKILTKDPLEAIKLKNEFSFYTKIKKQNDLKKKEENDKKIIKKYDNKEYNLDNDFKLKSIVSYDHCNEIFVKNALLFSDKEILNDIRLVLTKTGRISTKVVKDINKKTKIEKQMIKKIIQTALVTNSKMYEEIREENKK